MNQRKRKTFFAFVFFALIVALWVSEACAQSNTARPEPKRAGEVYRNIQVLKNLPADQLPPTMMSFAASLGVQCEFCHDKERYKDVKPQKATARKMLRMVLALNKQDITGTGYVTCNSCHHGRPSPKRIGG